MGDKFEVIKKFEVLINTLSEFNYVVTFEYHHITQIN